ncbi:tetratricopeptide repeat protein [Chryseolinea lacunae]|uniref:Tetratricopeptide repeat protein n=1 Tax=Chryseolinea lacunae TaxID=2801331 RepID=A0ABS1KNV8_9BACT|nr:tetratricopeptide repeat protein [Chryseolinea lacunae]MBL0741020.1 tetratricopeptide repeat protein [Chryseolinea lacunae]
MSTAIRAQETVFSFLKSDAAKADDYYAAKNYRQAVRLYETATANNNTDRYFLPIARSYYFLHHYHEAVTWYARALDAKTVLPADDLYRYAESLSAMKHYDAAIQYYTQYQNLTGNDALVLRKIWRLRNREFLFEDSIHYTVKRLSTNSEASDICPVGFANGFVFLSNRPRAEVVQQLDGTTPFFRLYRSDQRADTVAENVVLHYGTPGLFAGNLAAKFQSGPVSFFNNQKRMAYVTSGALSPKDKTRRTLQLFFADREGDGWKAGSPFLYNSTEYSIHATAVREDGLLLYFSSDMPGGFGGKDLYSCAFVNGQWSKPVNLGDQINTSGDESYPALVSGTLYFCSNGHAGLGGLDVFSVPLRPNGFGEVQNAGYPINTNFDDFGLWLNEGGSNGFLTSNREGSDDVFEVTVDLQTYPFLMTGILKFKEQSWSDSDDLKIFAGAKLQLIDNLKNAVVQSATADQSGMFKLTIPYFTQYRIKVIAEGGAEEVYVSLDLSKRRTADNTYEIVVVKNSFKKAN